ncbi:hypothetical protein Ahy_A10g048792 [Arachis hypogaea]|uniref:Uncharacterized protein n=1 Tax=Arachis hypogaea TaxID=3818 RepID=A0A445B5W0_ARAHY|nr:hypothetical protein Ahy_A10g048792 [Arachis hypogaea]
MDQLYAHILQEKQEWAQRVEKRKKSENKTLDLRHCIQFVTIKLAIATEIRGRVTGDARDAILAVIQEHVFILNSTFSWKESDRTTAKRSIHAFADSCQKRGSGERDCRRRSYSFVASPEVTTQELVMDFYETSKQRKPQQKYALCFGDLNDLRILPDAGQDLYIRVPASELGPSGLHGQWLGPSAEIKVQYPSSTDLTHVKDSRFGSFIIIESDYKQMLNTEVNIVIVPYTFLAVHVDSLNQAGQYDLVVIKELDQGPTASTMNSVLSLDDGRWSHPAIESCSPVPLPPHVLAQVYAESSPILPSKVVDPRPGPAKSSQDSGPGPNTYQHLHIFTLLCVAACENDGRFFEIGFRKHVEKLRDMWCSCRLPGKRSHNFVYLWKNRVIHIITLIIPKQESTSDSLSNCSTLNEEEIFEVQDSLSLFLLGWIHIRLRTLLWAGVDENAIGACAQLSHVNAIDLGSEPLENEFEQHASLRFVEV